MKADITSILESSENLKEDLLALGEELWMSIDHSDNASLQEGIEVKKEFNDAVQKFTDSIDEVSEIVDNDSSDKLDPAPESTTSEDADRVIRELDRRQARSLDEEFAYRRPHGFRLDDYAVSNVRTWRRLYEVNCHHLADRFAERFDDVAEADEFESSHENRYFSTDSEELRTPSKVAEVFSPRSISRPMTSLVASASCSSSLSVSEVRGCWRRAELCRGSYHFAGEIRCSAVSAAKADRLPKALFGT